MNDTTTDRTSLSAALAELMEDYARAIDRDELERWPDFFETKCIYKVTNRENVAAGYPIGVIYANSRAMLQDRVMSLRDANIYEDQCYRHLLGRPFITHTDGDTVHAETSFLVMRTMQDGVTSVFATGSYHDVLSVTTERIRFVERIVVCDSARIDTLMALPL
ncbi:aromatic-ring-hydroxylating dioxygenase subunit beta [Hydrogenophaga sp. BPS33]|uniref:aromatic-ring-hydroxylating dioxygenase subunit beta n=1 Tax=Hydrogenophaga sp. BPS33 TaxID=2651974 RepID=UPI00131F5D40|nr:aromatic-ring-hydroxylating dioxygenase subunit beta [Hydrogenophaga sp. BPS33]QHE84760.1 aromatic-ring-hydroxylating dioxygenase subunit beta [Hydrogenophaga sp. BPS33]